MALNHLLMWLFSVCRHFDHEMALPAASNPAAEVGCLLLCGLGTFSSATTSNKQNWINISEDCFLTCLLKRMLFPTPPPNLSLFLGLKSKQSDTSQGVIITITYIYYDIHTIITFAPNARLYWVPSRFITLVKFASRRTIFNTYYIFTDPRIKGFDDISQYYQY